MTNGFVYDMVILNDNFNQLINFILTLNEEEKMTKKELFKALENAPDDMIIEMAIRENPTDDPTWFEIDEVEDWKRDGDEHCLLYSGKIMMC